MMMVSGAMADAESTAGRHVDDVTVAMVGERSCVVDDGAWPG